MRHRKQGLKLNRTSSHRQAMFRNMVTSLFKYERIKTTDAKAKELRRWADNMITLAKRGDLHARRRAMSIIREKNVVHKLFDEAGDRFGAISGGYTRIIKVGRRPGDAAAVSIIELVTAEVKPKKKKRKKKKAQETAAPAPAAAEEASGEVDEGEEQQASEAAEPVEITEETEAVASAETVEAEPATDAAAAEDEIEAAAAENLATDEEKAGEPEKDAKKKEDPKPESSE